MEPLSPADHETVVRAVAQVTFPLVAALSHLASAGLAKTRREKTLFFWLAVFGFALFGSLCYALRELLPYMLAEVTASEAREMLIEGLAILVGLILVTEFLTRNLPKWLRNHGRRIRS